MTSGVDEGEQVVSSLGSDAVHAGAPAVLEGGASDDGDADGPG